MKTGQSSFKDHFSGHAGDYADFRPTYPHSMFEWLARQTVSNRLAWDCATGNGQAAIALADHFEYVIASDASPQQIAQAAEHPGISYRVEAAESSCLTAGTADLVTVAQAYHWLNHEEFLKEVERVLKPGGVLAVWTYSLARIDPSVDQCVYQLYEDILGPYWPPERALVEREYRDFVFPWQELAAPEFRMTASWDLPKMLGYLGTWSALRKYVDSTGENPLEEFRESIAKAWGEPLQTRPVHWPLVIRAFRKSP